jgi:predicted Zn-dependent protease
MMAEDTRKLWLAAVFVLLLGVAAFLGTRDDSEPPAGAADAVVENLPEEPAPDGPGFEEQLEDLRKQADSLQMSAPQEQVAEARRRFVEAARALGDQAIEAKRTDQIALVGRVLMEGGEGRFAEAFLQRSMGLLKPAEFGKDHMYPLAQLRRADGRALEAASLYERAIDVEPTTAAEYVGLSDLYLAAARMGPARAAVTRGLRGHADSVALKVQGAKVALLDGKAADALAVADEVLAASPEDVSAQLLRIEALLAAGSLEQAGKDSGALRDEYPADAWGWILGAVVAAAAGEPQRAREMLDQAAELAGDCPCTHEERLAILWAAKVGAASRVAPRSRAEVQKTAAAPIPAPPAGTPAPR